MIRLTSHAPVQSVASLAGIGLALMSACSGGNSATSGAGGSGAPGVGGAPSASGGESNAGAAGASAGAGNSGAAGSAAGSGGSAGTAGGSSGTGGAGSGAGGGGSGTSGTSGASGSTGGASPFSAGYMIGADISRVQSDAPGTLYTDTDGTQKDFLQIMKGHGFNYMRVRTFVDPRASDGNSKTSGFYDITHTVAFGKRIKDAGFGFLLDFHYSDNWADPGKQCVPVAWQGLTTNAQLANAVYAYTKDAITQLVAGGARPDMVAVGNEITPGMLFDICDSGGLPTGTKVSIGGSTSNWANLGALLKAGIQGVKDVDPTILIQLHLDRGDNFGTSRAWVDSAIAQGVSFDVLGESSYALYQCASHSTDGLCPSQVWQPTYAQLAARYPNLKFVAAEYGPLERELNDVLFDVPNQQGLGTFYWEPTHSGADNAGHVLFINRVAQPDLLLYDAMTAAYASRL